MLRRSGINAKHEGLGKEATVGWPYAGSAPRWSAIWPMSAQPRESDAHDPIFKVHRHPLDAVGAMAAGLTTSGVCRNRSERRWDARAWACATRFVPLPISATAIKEQATCTIGRDARLRLALHYWVKWNLLADRWATRAFQIENLTLGSLATGWCAHCERAHTCRCPPRAEAAARNRSIGDATVHARRGRARRRARITWHELEAADRGMAQVAARMAAAYGY